MKRSFSVILFFLFLTGLTFGQNTDQFSTKSAVRNYFIENKGQWEKDILFLAETSGMKVWITKDALVFDFFTVDYLKRSDNSQPGNPKDPVDSPVINGHVVKLKINSIDQRNSAKSEINTGESLSQYNNYFIGNDKKSWVSNVRLFNTVSIKNYIPGVDLRLYFDQGKFRYDLITQAGLDPNNIYLNFEGQENLQIMDFNTLTIKTAIGDIFHSDLSIYQEINTQKIRPKYEFRKISDQNIGFYIDNYDPALPVIIDPLIFSSYLGGNNYDWGYDVDIDGAGNAVVGGVTMSSNFPTTTGAYRRTAYGSYDVFVSKFNSNGSALIYSTYIGGWSVDYLYALRLDANGNCYLTGTTGSNNYPTTSGAFQTSFNGFYDINVTKLNSSGTALIYSTYIGGWSQDYGYDIELDGSNNAYICGYTIGSTNYPTSTSGYQRSLQGTSDCIITKFNSTGTGIIYSTYLGGSGFITEYCYGIDIDASGYAYVTGFTQSSNFPRTTGCYQSSLSGTQDAFVTKLNTTGSALSYSTLLGGNSTDGGYSIVVDGSGYAAVTGYTLSSNFPTTSGVYKTSSSGNQDGFITKLNLTGTALSYSTYIGGNGADQPSRIAIDQNNFYIIAGQTSSSNLTTTLCALQTTNGGSSDLFINVLNSTLSTLVYSSYLGGNNIDYGTGLVINSSGEAYVTGYSMSNNFPTTGGAYQRTWGAGYDAVLSKFPYIALAMNGTINNSYCAGTPFSMPFIAGCSFNSGNVFTIQLSNASGSFSSPVSLGSASRQTSGTINCYIPKNTPYGSGYRIRLVSSNPSNITADNGFNIRINPSPNSQFTINIATQCLDNNNFTFTNSSTISSGNFSNLWRFGDNTTSTLTNPSHTYTNDTNYVVKLICISDSGCRDSLSRNISIYPSPHTNFTVNDSAQCLDNNLFAFNSTTTISQGTFSIRWDFGDGDTASQSNINHSYLLNNNFNVKLIAISNNGCKDSTIRTMKILPSPNSGFSINDTGQCLNSNLFAFTNKTSILQGNVTYLWRFGDGATSTIVNPSHTYITASNYTVDLIATSDSGCRDTASLQISLAPIPIAGFSINATPQCQKGNLFTFTNTSTVSSGTIKYLWSFGNGNTDTIKNPDYSYPTDGNYNVSLIAKSTADCADTISKQVVVNPSPVSSFTVSDSDQCFNSNNFIFTNLSTIKSGSLTYLWNFGDAATSTTTNATHSYLADNNYKVKLFSTSDMGCKDSVSKNILIYSSPKSSFFVNDSDQCLDKNSFSFTNTSNIKTGTIKFRWFFGDTKSDTVRNPVHAYTKHGNYSVSLISTSNKNCRDTFTRMVYVYPLPIASFNVNNSIQCLKGNNFIFSNTSTIPTGAIAFRWTFGDGFQSTDPDPNHNYLGARIYDVTLYATSAYGCSDTIKTTVTVNMMPKANYNVSVICMDEPVAFTDRSFINNPDVISQWIWDFGDGSTSTDQNPIYTFTKPGTFGVRQVVVSNNGCRDSIIKPVYIRDHVSPPVLDRVSVRTAESDIEVEWIPPSSGYVKDYILEKSFDNIYYSVLSHPDRQTTRYIDASVLPDSMPYYFRIKAIDSCSYGSDYSNYGKSILLHTTNAVHIAELNWTPYEEWSEGIDHYEIELFDNKISNYINVGTVDASILEFFDDVTALNQSDYCYRVAAVRNGDGTKVYSNSDCVPVSFGCFIPNSFTPNGDSLNDVLLAVGTSVFKFNLAIFDRWGNLVFESNDMNIGWDGTKNGTKAPEGYYYYQMSARGIKNQKAVSKGSLLLLR